MKHHATALLAACTLAALPSVAQAVTVRVEVTGTVDFNVIGGSMAGVQSGAPAVMGFNVDSANFLNSPNFPTRGYAIDLASFSMTVSGRPVTLDNPQPGATAYFVLRNNDPAVDGFFISLGNVEVDFPLSVHIPGLVPAHELDFHATYGNTTTLGSLNILDAVGTYGFTNISVYQWTIGRFGNPGAEYVYQGLTITVVPEPAALSLLGLGLLGVLARTSRRRPAA